MNENLANYGIPLLGHDVLIIINNLFGHPIYKTYKLTIIIKITLNELVCVSLASSEFDPG